MNGEGASLAWFTLHRNVAAMGLGVFRKKVCTAFFQGRAAETSRLVITVRMEPDEPGQFFNRMVLTNISENKQLRAMHKDLFTLLICE